MICPKCKAEYVLGIVECADCRIPLVEGALEDSPEKESFHKLVPILELGNQADLAVAKSLLEGAGIIHHIKNEGVQNLFGAGSLGTGFNPLTGPMIVMVEKTRAQEAKELLGDFK